MTLTVGLLRFATASDFDRHFAAIRSKYPLGATVSGKDVEDLYELLDFLAPKGRVPRREETAHFIVDKNRWGKHSCFFAVTTKGSRVPLSASRASLYASAYGAQIAFRLLARNETKLRKNGYGDTVACYHCRTLVPRVSVEMDHYPEGFDVLLKRFLNAKGLSIEKIRAVPEGEGLYRLENDELKREWMTFHKREAELVPSCLECNRVGGPAPWR